MEKENMDMVDIIMMEDGKVAKDFVKFLELKKLQNFRYWMC